MSGDNDTATIVQAFSDALSTNYVGVASMTFLLYDHLLTFDDEVTYIWRRRKGLIGTLFLINRYLTPFGFVVNMVAYLSPFFDMDLYPRCRHFVRYEGAFTTVSLGIVAIMMIVRINALYGGNRAVTSFVIGLLLAQVSVQAYLLANAIPVPQLQGQASCTMIFSTKVGAFASAYAWMPLIFDTSVLFLTIYRTLSVVRAGAAGNVVRTFVRDGVLYYGVIFCANAVLSVMLVAAPDGIKGIVAQLEQLITVTMMSRITINLKKQNALESGEDVTTQRIRTMSFSHSSTEWSHRRRRAYKSSQDQSFELSVMVNKDVTSNAD